MKPTHAIQVAVVLERVAQPNDWEPWTFRLLEVVPDQGAFGSERRRLFDDGKTSRWLYPGITVALFPDECKGYFLNLTSGRPSWFVSWRPDGADPSQVELTGVGVSYIEADRRLTAEEVVENLPLDAELCEWLQAFTNAHFVPETRRKVRAMSFLTPEQREGQAAAAPAEAPAPLPAEPRSRNEALKQMFLTDPHFRQSDGLDVGVEEVFEIASSPLARQRKIQQARALGLLDDELLDQDPPPPDPAAR